MIELATVIDALAIIWALVGCVFGLYILIGLLEGIILGVARCHGRKRNENQ